MTIKKVELKEYDKNALDDLLGSSATQEESTKKNTTTLPIDSIILPPSQPRRYFDTEALQSLANDIKAQGLLAPIAVRYTSGNTYELMAGERRLRACKIAGLEEIAVNIIDCDEKTATRIRLAENLQREDLNAYEETIGILELLALELDLNQDTVISLLYEMNNETKGNSNHNVMVSDDALTLQDIFSKLSKITWQSFVANRLPLLKLPGDIQSVLAKGELEYTKATTISKIKDLEQRQEVLKQAIEEKLSLSQIKKIVGDTLKASKQEKQETPTRELATRVGKISSLLRKDKTLNEDKKRLNKVNKLIEQLMELLKLQEEIETAEETLEN
ncbi:chromosome partitioning protein ParB (plasmid) [Brasilonema octagenarum UFV-E1]|uniref:Chromosome partitioning protein ParB n=2 Tax=Brasilonema TaxID=383614 RepID=A0A856MRC2_9CYAN|nr:MULTISPECIES: ParB/RepB/Spo0J family partition protein [Brasilonema]NMF65939.1 chromosome partitioning protein ParB [Brasilonema octagenarum UFV-OR1]QDL12720.1 chromosome partitioning protein ParB [Brasilonema sennae CENA114]QDL19114.1 chromosome partitioning protein ParB [Brasilonema octagenarum UFV-E1]